MKRINYQNARFLTSLYRTENITLPPLPEIALAGRSNVGKSSLINRLLNRKKLARVSETPGKTVSVNYYDIDGKYYLVDLPGYGFAKRSKKERATWGRLINGYLAADRNLRLILLLIDIRHSPSEEDRQMYEYLMANQTLFAVIATKADKLSAAQVRARIQELSKEFLLQVIPFSAKTGQGAEELLQIIEDIALQTE